MVGAWKVELDGVYVKGLGVFMEVLKEWRRCMDLEQIRVDKVEKVEYRCIIAM